MKLITIDTLDLNDKRVLLREDFNVPIQNGEILNDARIKAALPTIQELIEKKARVLILSHLGRPTEGKFLDSLSLKPVAQRLSELLNQPVRLEQDWLQEQKPNKGPEKGQQEGQQTKKIERLEIMPGEVVLAENVRFNLGEKANDSKLAKKMADWCDVFVMDAFATAHRAEASTAGIAEFAPIAAAGPLLVKEIDALERVLKDPKKPVVAVIGGAKISSKLPVLEALLKFVDILIVGGGIANPFIALKYTIGQSVSEPDAAKIVQAIKEKAETQGVFLVTPVDAVVAKKKTLSNEKTVKDPAFSYEDIRVSDLTDIDSVEQILDVGPKTSEFYRGLLKNANTILWNGPVGLFENPDFSQGTEKLALAIASSDAFSIAGGGETLAAIDNAKVADKISYISTGGGAFLEYVEGKKLPAITMLEQRAREKT